VGQGRAQHVMAVWVMGLNEARLGQGIAAGKTTGPSTSTPDFRHLLPPPMQGGQGRTGSVRA
jgi:hypothetical protein